MSGFQPASQLHARHVHKVHVEHDAAELRRRSVAEKGFSRGVSLGPQTTAFSNRSTLVRMLGLSSTTATVRGRVPNVLPFQCWSAAECGHEGH